MNTCSKTKRFLRYPEASEEYNLTIPLLRKLVGMGLLQSVRPAGSRVVLIPREALDAMMKEDK